MTYRVLDLKKEKKYVKLFVNDQKKKMLNFISKPSICNLRLMTIAYKCGSTMDIISTWGILI